MFSPLACRKSNLTSKKMKEKYWETRFQFIWRGDSLTARSSSFSSDWQCSWIQRSWISRGLSLCVCVRWCQHRTGLSQKDTCKAEDHSCPKVNVLEHKSSVKRKSPLAAMCSRTYKISVFIFSASTGIINLVMLKFSSALPLSAVCQNTRTNKVSNRTTIQEPKSERTAWVKAREQASYTASKSTHKSHFCSPLFLHRVL